jgi:ribose 5-phosphate isomerase B
LVINNNNLILISNKKSNIKMLDAKGYEVTNYGTDTEESVDYPDFDPVAQM